MPATTLYLHQADVLLCAPRVGSGMQVKVLDAVVTSAEGMEGIPVIDGVQPASVRTTRS